MSAGLPLSTIGPYRVIDELGAGGMGTVYRVSHLVTGRVAAAKVLHAGPAAMRALDRFRNEARILGALRHPNIASMHEFLEVGGAPCLVMEYVDGDTLDALLRVRGPFALPEALRVMAALAGAVGYIHARGVIHRDLKSNNVKIDSRGVVKLLDFGIATSQGMPRLTSTGNVVGTLASLAPEQLRTGRAEARSDIWALGVLFYELLTGRMPFTGGASGFVGEQIMQGKFDPPTSVRAELPREVDRIVRCCLRVKPEDRYPNAEALLDDVSALMSGERAPESFLPAGFTPPEIVRSSGEIATRVARQWPLVASALVAAAAVVFFVATLRGPGPDAPPPERPARELEAAVTGPANDTAASMSLRPLNIRVLEGTADVYIDGVRVGTTPYTWRAPLGTEATLILRREGCEELRRTLRLDEGMQETIESMTRCRTR